ncbi:MAG TPA: YheV family putative metal-binding protein [Pseudomonadales bacterium]
MKRPRFIAGAVCPKCGAMDRLQVIGDGDERARRCVSCGHQDQLSGAASPSPRSRLDGGLKPAGGDEHRQTVRIIAPSAGRKDGPSRPGRRGNGPEE